MKKTNIFQNAVILTVTSFILRFFGMIIRSYISGVIGEEGMGLYQLILSIYVLSQTIISTGISTAIIRLIADSFARNENISIIKSKMRKVFKISIFISIITMIIFYLIAEPIGVLLLNDDRSILPIRLLLIALVFISISSCIKSYFIAVRKIIINSISQLVEQVVRIVIVFFLLHKYGTGSIETAIIYIVFSDIISEIVSCIFLFLNYYKDTKNVLEDKSTHLDYKIFFGISIPVTVSKCATSLLRTAENILIPNLLAIYTSSNSDALKEFGLLKGMALPLVFFPASFLNALSTLLVPETSEALALKQKGKITRMLQTTCSFTLSSAIIISALFFNYSRQITDIFYPGSNTWIYIKYLSPLIPFMYLESAIMGLMQGLNQQNKILKYNCIDSFFRIGFIILTVPKIGMIGFIAIMYISNIMTSSLNTIRALKITNTKFDFSCWIIKPLLCALSSTILFDYISNCFFFSNKLFNTLFLISFNSIVYLVLLIMFGIIDLKKYKVFYRKI